MQPIENTTTEITLSQIQPHPDNPRMTLREDVVERLAAEIRRDGFRPEHAILVRPHGDTFQLISGHHRVEAARRAGLATIPAWTRNLDDDEAFMQLILCNSQGELTPLEEGRHIHTFVRRGRGRDGGLAAYARRLAADGEGKGRESLRQRRDAYAVFEKVQDVLHLSEPPEFSLLYEISKADESLWETLVRRAIEGNWTVADAIHHVELVRKFDIPGEWHWWLDPKAVARRHLETREFSAQTVKRLIAAAAQTRDWINANATDPADVWEKFRTWAVAELPASWQPRAVAGYLQGLIATQFVVEGWHHGDWRDHLDKAEDSTVALLLTDPPYGMNYQSDYRLDRRTARKHERITADDTDAPTEVQTMLEAFRPKLADDAHVLLFCGWANEPDMREAVTKAGYTLRGSLIWDKQATGMGDPTTTFAPAHERILHAVKGSPPLYRRAADLLRHPRCDSSRHPTEKPVSLLQELIEATTVEGQVVADPYGGVASTPAAAKESGRRWFGCELAEDYWRAGEERLLA